MKRSTFGDQSQQQRWSQMLVLLALAVLVLFETASAQESTLKIASAVKGKANPTGVAMGVIAFNAPPGDGRRGANGLYVTPRKSTTPQISEFAFTYRRSRDSRGVQIIHPLKNGHILVTILQSRINIIAGGTWPGYFGRKSTITEHTDAYAEMFPLEEGQLISVLSRVFPSGFVEVAIDGTVMATAVADAPSVFELTNGFKLNDASKSAGISLPKTWPAGAAGILVGPLDRGTNIAEKIVLSHFAVSSIPDPARTLPGAKKHKPTESDKSSESELTLKIADSVKGKARPVGVRPGVTAFQAPPGDGRRGSNGLYIPPPLPNAELITELSFTYQRDGSARGVQVIHPLGAGHVVMSILPDRININSKGLWPGHFGQKTPSLELTDAFASTFPVKDRKIISVRTRVLPDGLSEVVIDGKVMATAITERALPFELKYGFKLYDGSNPKGASLPGIWPAGSAGIIVGPLDGGLNAAQKIVFHCVDVSAGDGP